MVFFATIWQFCQELTKGIRELGIRRSKGLALPLPTPEGTERAFV